MVWLDQDLPPRPRGSIITFVSRSASTPTTSAARASPPRPTALWHRSMTTRTGEGHSTVMVKRAGYQRPCSRGLLATAACSFLLLCGLGAPGCGPDCGATKLSECQASGCVLDEACRYDNVAGCFRPSEPVRCRGHADRLVSEVFVAMIGPDGTCWMFLRLGPESPQWRYAARGDPCDAALAAYNFCGRP
jgi:hypothetical protein